MKQEKMFRAVGDVGDDLIHMAQIRKFRPSVWRRVLPMAACLAVIVAVGALVVPKFAPAKNPPVGNDTQTAAPDSFTYSEDHKNNAAEIEITLDYEPNADTVTTPADKVQEEPEAPAVDYTVFSGRYTDTETVEGPCYTVRIVSVDAAAGEMELELSYVGLNSSPVYTADGIRGVITQAHTVEFTWKDSWSNQGNGVLVLDPADPSAVQLLMTLTEEAAVNRGTLSTHDQYKTLYRRETAD